MQTAIKIAIIKWIGSVFGKPDSKAEIMCPKNPKNAPATGPRIIAPIKAGKESRAMEPRILIFAPITQRAKSIANVANFFVEYFIIIPSLKINTARPKVVSPCFICPKKIQTTSKITFPIQLFLNLYIRYPDFASPYYLAFPKSGC